MTKKQAQELRAMLRQLERDARRERAQGNRFELAELFEEAAEEIRRELEESAQ